jgi:non-specific serine/threonine protein kinase/serine/threonine-protein kinase
LYHLLAGAPPHKIEGKGMEALRVILEVDPPRPSTTAPPGRGRALVGDLDNIVLKALRKEPRQRYASVEQMSDDLRRYTLGLPVEARAGSWSYRAGKLLRRHSVFFAAATMVLATLTTATVVSVGQARRADAAAREARAEFDAVRRLANSLVFEVDDAIRDLEGATGARDLVVRRALEYLDYLAERAGGDAVLARDLAAAYVKIGDIEGSPAIPNLGRVPDGLASYTKAQAILEQLPREDPQNRWALAQTHYGVANLYLAQGDTERVRSQVRTAEDLWATLPSSFPFNHDTVERGYQALAYVDSQVGDLAGAQHAIDSELALAERWEQSASTPENRYWIAIAHENRASILRGPSGDSAGAVADIHTVLEIVEGLVAREPASASYRQEHAYALMLAGMYLGGVGDGEMWIANEGDRAGAEEMLRRAEVELERLTQNTRDTHAQMIIADVDSALGALVAEHDLAGGIAELERGRARFGALPAAVRGEAYVQQNEYLTRCALADVLARAGRADEAREEARVGLAMAEHGTRFQDRLHLESCRYLVGRAWHTLGDLTASQDLLEQVVVQLRELVAEQPAVVPPYVGLLDTLSLLAELRPTERCRLLAEAATIIHGWRGTQTEFLRKRDAQLTQFIASCK